MFTPESASAAGKIGGKQPKKRDVVTQHIIAELNEIDEETGISYARKIARALVRKAANESDMMAIREAIDRTDGKPTQDVAIEHSGELTLTSVIVSELNSFFSQTAGRLEDRSNENVVSN